MTDDLIVCTSCASINRVPPQKIGAGPKCGRCHAPLFPGEPTAVNAVMFDKLISRGTTPVLVDFWANWCGPCRMMAPAFAAAARQLEPHIRLAKVDTEAEQPLAARYGIRSIPTMILFAGGREVARQSGAMGEAQIIAWARAALPGHA